MSIKHHCEGTLAPKKRQIIQSNKVVTAIQRRNRLILFLDLLSKHCLAIEGNGKDIVTGKNVAMAILVCTHGTWGCGVSP